MERSQPEGKFGRAPIGERAVARIRHSARVDDVGDGGRNAVAVFSELVSYPALPIWAEEVGKCSIDGR